MKVSKLVAPGKAYKVAGQTAVFMTLSTVTATSEAILCYGDFDGYYDIFVAKYNYVKGAHVKRWAKTKGRSNLTWKKAVKLYNEWNNK